MTTIIDTLSIKQLEFIIASYGSVVEFIAEVGNYVIVEDIVL